jgi:FkbM family methyltransferase
MIALYRRLKIWFRILIGTELNYKNQLNVSMMWYGKTGAGFFVCEEYLSKDSIIYSFGVGEEVSFDMQLIDKFGCKVYAFDPTPKSIKYVNNLPLNDNFIFFPYGIYRTNGFLKFYLPENKNYVSGSSLNRWKYDEREIKPIEVPVKTFSTIVAELGHTKIDVLKMDIEGAEYEVIDDVLNSGINIKQILVEVHHRFPGVGVKKTQDFIDTLNREGYKIARISDSKEEYSFIKEYY